MVLIKNKIKKFMVFIMTAVCILGMTAVPASAKTNYYYRGVVETRVKRVLFSKMNIIVLNTHVSKLNSDDEIFYNREKLPIPKFKGYKFLYYVDGRRKKTSTSPNFVYRCVNPKKDTYNVDVIIKKKVREKYKTVAKLNILFDGMKEEFSSLANGRDVGGLITEGRSYK